MQPTDHGSASQDDGELDFLDDIASDQPLNEEARRAQELEDLDRTLMAVGSTPEEPATVDPLASALQKLAAAFRASGVRQRTQGATQPIGVPETIQPPVTLKADDAESLAEHSATRQGELPASFDAAASGEDDIEDLISACEENWSTRGPKVSPHPVTPSKTTASLSGESLSTDAAPEAAGKKAPPLDERFIPPSSLAYDAFQAKKDLHDLMNFMRHLARRNSCLRWSSVATPEASGEVGKTSKNAIVIGNTSLKDKLHKEERRFRNFLPTYFRQGIASGSATEVPELALPRLQAWKRLPGSGRAPQVNELLFGLRVCSLAHGERPADLNDWRDAPVPDGIGLMEVTLSGDAAERFLSDAEGSGPNSLARGLLRSLETVSHVSTDMIAMWTRDDHIPNTVRVFIALKHADNRTINAAINLDRSTRYVQGLDRVGVTTVWGRASRGDIDRLEEELSANPPTSTDRLPEYPDDGDEEEFIPGQGFATRQQINARNALIGERWSDRMRAHGLPIWFSLEFVEQIREYLLRDPVLADQRRKVNRRLSKTTRVQADYRERDLLDAIEAQLTDLRFYWGSPAQFASLAASSGTILGSYTSSKHKAGRAKELYEAIREAQPTSL